MESSKIFENHDLNPSGEGVFYNLDDRAMKKALKYESEEELYTFYEQMGEGSFSHVFKAMFKPTGEVMAVKIIKAEKDTETLRELMK